MPFPAAAGALAVIDGGLLVLGLKKFLKKAVS
jgi:hypothetical protein